MRIQLAVEVFKRAFVVTTILSTAKAEIPAEPEPEQAVEEVDLTSMGFQQR